MYWNLAVFCFYLKEINLFIIMFLWERKIVTQSQNQGKSICIVEVALTSPLPPIWINYPWQANDKQMQQTRLLVDQSFPVNKTKVPFAKPKVKIKCIVCLLFTETRTVIMHAFQFSFGLFALIITKPLHQWAFDILMPFVTAQLNLNWSWSLTW